MTDPGIHHRVQAAAGLIRAAWKHHRDADIATEAAQVLEDNRMLRSPEDRTRTTASEDYPGELDHLRSLYGHLTAMRAYQTFDAMEDALIAHHTQETAMRKAAGLTRQVPQKQGKEEA